MPAPVCHLGDTTLPEQGCQSLPQTPHWWGRGTDGGLDQGTGVIASAFCHPALLPLPACVAHPALGPCPYLFAASFRACVSRAGFPSRLMRREGDSVEQTHQDSIESVGALPPSLKASALHSPPCPISGLQLGTHPASVASFSPLGHCSSPGPHQDRVECQPDRSFWEWLMDANPAFPWGPKCANVSLFF